MPENSPLNRRQFAKTLAAGAGGLLGGASLSNAQERVNPDNRPKPMPTRDRGEMAIDTGLNHHWPTGKLSADGKTFQEDGRAIPVKADYDVIVCGSGPAGFSAALAAARTGAKTALLEVNGCVGGVWTAGMLSWIIDGGNKPGIMAEIFRGLEKAKGGRMVTRGNYVYHPDDMKLLLEKLLMDAGINVRLHTRVVGAARDHTNRLAAVLTESKSGREVWTAKSFIDCTGDGDLSAQAGCEFEFGRPQDGITQPFSLMALFTGVTTEGIAPFVNHLSRIKVEGHPKANLLAEFRRAGVEPSYGGPTIFEIHDGLYAMMANHQYNNSAINADDVSRATLEARQEVHKLVTSLQKLGGPWADVELVCTAEHIGTREARRVQGRYYLSSDDLREGTKFDDGICRVTFGIDVHSTDPKATKEIESKPFKPQHYDIPLRALLARDVDGLMVAGRCISGDFIAHSSYRVTGNAVAMGEAAGVTSALAATNGTLPHSVPFGDVAKGLGTLRRAYPAVA